MRFELPTEQGTRTFAAVTQRTKSHETADRAVVAVSGIWVGCGWVCDPVRSDYGDDLLVQTTWNGIIDPYRLAIQVKGTRNSAKYRTQTGKLHYSVSRQHLIYWTRNRGLSVFVLWDVNRNEGWYALPLEQYSDYKLFMSKASRLTLQLSQTFDQTAALSLAWEARLTHFEGMLIEKLFAEEFDRVFGEPSTNDSRANTVSISLDLLVILNVLKKSGRGYALNPDYERALVQEISKTIREGRKLYLTDEIAISLIKHIKTTTGGGGTPHAVLLAGCPIIEGLLPRDVLRNLTRLSKSFNRNATKRS